MKRLFAVAAFALLAGCGEPDLKKADFNVHYQLGSKSLYLGQAKGLDQCGALAWSQAQIDGVAGTNRWGYVCCLITKDSQCESKHR